MKNRVQNTQLIDKRFYHVEGVNLILKYSLKNVIAYYFAAPQTPTVCAQHFQNKAHDECEIERERDNEFQLILYKGLNGFTAVCLP